MKNSFLRAARAAFLVSAASASDVVTNHVRNPLEKTLSPNSWVRVSTGIAKISTDAAPTHAPGGLAGNNFVTGLSWIPTLVEIATYADNSVQQADVGSTVAGLDNLGNVTAPVSTSGNIAAKGTAQLGTVPAMGAWAQTARASFFTNNGDISSSPHLIHFGGLQDHADAYLNLIGYTMGHADNSGSILTVQDTDGSFYGNRSGAGGTDSVLFLSKINGTAPRLEAGA